MNVQHSMETALKNVQTPMEATCVHVYLVISLAQIIKVVMVRISEYIKMIVIAYFISDINECSANNGDCLQLCTNTNGSYVCSCVLGYQLSADNQTCNGNQLFIGS